MLTFSKMIFRNIYLLKIYIQYTYLIMQINLLELFHHAILTMIITFNIVHILYTREGVFVNVFDEDKVIIYVVPM